MRRCGGSGAAAVSIKFKEDDEQLLLELCFNYQLKESTQPIGQAWHKLIQTLRQSAGGTVPDTHPDWIGNPLETGLRAACAGTICWCVSMPCPGHSWCYTGLRSSPVSLIFLLWYKSLCNTNHCWLWRRFAQRNHEFWFLLDTYIILIASLRSTYLRGNILL